MKTYKGVYNGSEYSSIYPNLYRVKYESCLGGRRREFESIRSAQSDHHARQRITDSFLISYPEVELVCVLEEASE